MKTSRLITFFLISYVLAAHSLYGQKDHTALLEELDRAIDSTGFFVAAKQHRIDLLKEKFSATDPESPEAYDINLKLLDEYWAFLADSALSIINANAEWARRHGDRNRFLKSRIMLIYMFSITGFYAEAREVILSLDRKELDDSVLFDYYNSLYRYYTEVLYSPDKGMHRMFDDRRVAYRDSLLSVYDMDQPHHDYAQMSWLLYGWKQPVDQALAIHKELLAGCEPYSHEYAQLAHRVSQIYVKMGDTENRITYLARSAIADVRSAIKNQASITFLAEELYAKGMVDRAYRYVQFAWKESLAFNSRMRLRNNAELMAIVDKHQHDLIASHNERIRHYIYIISFALAMLLLTLWFVYVQNRQLAKIRDELKVANDSLKGENEALLDANKLKVALVTQFMMQCSTHIKSLDSWRKMVYGKIVKGKSKELLSVSDNEELGKDLDEFYHNFDSAFLQMYPHFIERFNDLLQEDERIVLKKWELMNPELRIFALIHLGISDSSQIAELLHYSVNTIYNYRAKVKNRARVSRDQFESLVTKIK